MQHDTTTRGSNSGERAPPAVRRSVLAAIGIFGLGAIYLIAVRGEAIIVDLTALAGRVWCF